MYLFRLRLGKRFVVGMANHIDLEPSSPQLYEEQFPTPSLVEMRARIQSILEKEGQEMPSISCDGSHSPRKATDPESPRKVEGMSLEEGELVRKLQPRSKENSVTYTCFSVSFDTKRITQGACSRIFASLAAQGWEAEEARAEEERQIKRAEDNGEYWIPSMFSQIGKEFSKSAKSTIKSISGLVRGSDETEASKESFPLSLSVDIERERFLGVQAWKAAEIFGFLEQPWGLMLPNVPILFPKDIKSVMDHWRA
jgi:hypothetical protein